MLLGEQLAPWRAGSQPFLGQTDLNYHSSYDPGDIEDNFDNNLLLLSASKLLLTAYVSPLLDEPPK